MTRPIARPLFHPRVFITLASALVALMGSSSAFASDDGSAPDEDPQPVRPGFAPAPAPMPAAPLPTVYAPLSAVRPGNALVFRPDWQTARRGFHFGLGIGGGYIPVLDAGGLEAHAILNYGIGPIDLRVSPTLYYGASRYGGGSGLLFLGELRFNLGSTFTVGFGPVAGYSIDSRGRGSVTFGAIVTPVALRFLERGNLEIGLFVAPLYGISTRDLSYTGGLQISYVFF